MARQNLRRNRMGSKQIETLICYMEQHTLFARGQIPKLGAQGHVKYKTMWNDLANLLNRIGPSQKTVTAWQKSWTKLRLNAKTEKAKFIKALTKTGHDTPDTDLNERDNRISQIFGNYGTGMNIGRELGFKKRLQLIQRHETEDYSDAVTWLNSIYLQAVHSQRLLDIIPLRINDIFVEFTQHLISAHQSNFDRKKPAVQKPSDKQIQCLVDFMERHPALANGVDPNAEENWNILLVLIHGVEGKKAIKTVKGWKKTWDGLINAARQSMKFFLDGRKETPMLPHHIRIIDLVGWEDNSVRQFLGPCQAMVELPPPSQPSCYLPTASRTDFNKQSSSCLPTASHTDFNRNQGIPSTSNAYLNLPSTSRCLPAQGQPPYKPPRQPQMSLNGEPFRKMMKFTLPANTAASSTVTRESTQDLSNIPLVSNQSIPTASTSTAPRTTASAGAEKSQFLKAFEEKGVEIVSTLANQLIGCFDKQNEALKNGLKDLGESILETLPKMIGEEFNKALKNASVQGPVVEESKHETEEIVVESCAICQDVLVDPKTLKCDHTFCRLCIDTWIRNSKFCPICREAIEAEDLPEEEWSWDALVPSDTDEEL